MRDSQESMKTETGHEPMIYEYGIQWPSGNVSEVAGDVDEGKRILRNMHERSLFDGRKTTLVRRVKPGSWEKVDVKRSYCKTCDSYGYHLSTHPHPRSWQDRLSATYSGRVDPPT